MKVLEIKNNLVKVSYNSEDKLVLAGFTVIEDEKTPYVGQIVSLKADNGESYAIVRLLFTFDEEGIVKNYDGSIPKLDANVSKLTCQELLDILPVERPIKIGQIAQQKFLLNVDSSILKKNLLICSDIAKNTELIVSNLVKQCENQAESSVIIDTDGRYENFNKFTFGKHFKLPLNFETINFIYGNDLNDVDSTSKAVIQDIFLEVQEYTRSVPEGFIPFDTFINVVDQQYSESGIPELALLKNKLLKYKEENVFAQSKYEINSLKEYIKDNYSVVLDISNTNAPLQKELISYIYKVLDEMGANIYSFVKINNENSDKKLLKNLIKNDKISSTIICNHNYKYVYELKEQAENFLLFAPETTQHDFATYNTFLNKLNHDEFIIYGSTTQQIPLIIELAPLEIIKDKDDEPVVTTQSVTTSEEEQNTEETEKSSDNTEVENVEEEEEQTEDIKIVPVPTEDFTENADTYTDLSDNVERKPQEEEDYSALNTEEEIEEEPIEDDFDKELAKGVEENLLDEPELEINEEASTNDFFTETKLQQDAEVVVDEPTYIEEPETQEEVIELPQEFPIQDDITPEEKLETFEEVEDIPLEQEEIIEDEQNDEAFNEEPIIESSIEEPIIEEDLQNLQMETEEIQEDYSENESIEPIIQTPFENNEISEPAPLINEDILGTDSNEQINLTEEVFNEPVNDSLTEDDLNFIDDINNGEIDATEDNSEASYETEDEENFASHEEPPVVPVYAAKMPTTNQTFEQGDHVSHPKYGEGIVEKMIKYGNKTLCAINFVNIGRRLLDPAISEITKM